MNVTKGVGIAQGGSVTMKLPLPVKLKILDCRYIVVKVIWLVKYLKYKDISQILDIKG